MKKTIKSTISVILTLVILAGLISCVVRSDPWQDAIYRTDTELGSGSITFTLEVKALENKVAFTVSTDEKTVGDALLKVGLIDGEEGPYGLYVKKVNGMTADYDTDQSYWAFYINGEYANYGIEQTEVTEGAVYQLEYTR